jgi:hypothetical protein
VRCTTCSDARCVHSAPFEDAPGAPATCHSTGMGEASLLSRRSQVGVSRETVELLRESRVGLRLHNDHDRPVRAGLKAHSQRSIPCRTKTATPYHEVVSPRSSGVTPAQQPIRMFHVKRPVSARLPASHGRENSRDSSGRRVSQQEHEVPGRRTHVEFARAAMSGDPALLRGFLPGE